MAAANVAALLAGVLALSVSGPTSAARGECPSVGFSPGSMLMTLNDADLARDLDEMVATGAQWLRMDFSWSAVEKTQGSFSWGRIDRVVDAATSRGLKVIALLAYTPNWARAADTDSIMYPPIDPNNFATFARAAVQRYSARVKVWQVWNEPNITQHWRPKPDPVAYTNLLKPAYGAIKAVDPGATVLSAGLSPAVDAADGTKISPPTFLRTVYGAGGGGSFDAVAIHPYSYPARPIDPSTAHWNTFHRLPLVYDVMLANGDGHKSIWLTEFGAPTGTHATAVSEAEQAAIITDGVNAFAQFPWAKNLMIYANRDAGTDPLDREHNFGVVRWDFSPKLARDALKKAVATSCAATQPATLSIGDATVREGNAGTSTATFRISRSGDTERSATVVYRTVTGTASGGSDFVEAPETTVSFAAGETTKEVTVAVRGDTIPEGVETFSITLSSPSGGTVADDTGVGTILDDDPFPSLAVDDLTLAEGPLGTSAATFTVTRRGNTAAWSSVQYRVEAGTALAGIDFLTVPLTTMTFAPGETAKSVPVTVLGNAIAEPAKTFSLKLSSPVGATIADDTGLGTIGNDDSGEPTSVRVGDATVTEGNSGTVPVTFVLTRSGDTSRTSSVQYITNSATAVGAVDYVRVAPTTATFAPGETTKTVTTSVIGDTTVEGNESFYLNLSAPVGTVFADAQGVATIVDDDAVIVPGPSPLLAVSDVTVTEGNVGTTPATFTVSRSGSTGGTSSVEYAVTPGTATPGVDYTTAAPGTITFAPGETTKTVTLGVVGDLVLEGNETFFLDLSALVGGAIADVQGVAVIVDDDSLLGLGTVSGPATFVAVDDVNILEGNSGTVAANFVLTRSGNTGLASSVVYATAPGTATPGSDYASVVPATATFAPGQTAATVTVPVNGDTVDEPNETFLLDLSLPTNATISDAQGVATIVDDDPTVVPGPSTFLHVSNVVTVEGDAGPTPATFTITRSGDTGGSSSVQYATTGAGTATAGSDYVAVPPTTVTFAPGETTRTVAVTVNGDAEGEADESFFVRLSGAVGATVSDDVGNGTITDDDTGPGLAVDDVTMVEGDAGTTAFTFTITRSASTAVESSVQYSTASGTATGGVDFVPVPLTTATFAAGETTKTVVVNVNGDAAGEGDETFQLNLSAPERATLGDGVGTGTIVNDDALPTLAVNDLAVLEAEGGAWAIFSVSRTGDASVTSTVQYATAPGTATEGSDYVGLPTAKMTFGPGERTKIVTVRVVADAISEPDETFFLNLSSPTSAAVADGQGVATVRAPTATASATTSTTAATPTTASATTSTTAATPTTASATTSTTAATTTTTLVATTATFLHPLAGAQGVDLSTPFSWTAVPGVQAYYLYIGTSRGAYDVDQSGETLATFFTPRQLPAGRTLWGRIWTKSNGAWTYSDVSFTTSTSLAPTTAAFLHPLEGAKGVDRSKPFSWTAVPDVQAYYLYVGTTRGARDVDESGEILTTSYTPKQLLPGRTLWARIWS